MATEAYKRQVRLLLTVLPEVAKEKCFALHGGTAINLFVRNMPRLSVDIDLTYIPLEDRDTSLKNIAEALERIKERIEKILPNIQLTHATDRGKLLISEHDASIKIEVNPVKRGVLEDPVKMPLCQKAQDEFEAFCAIDVVPQSQLFGDKICAALDRQHPRDLFDVKYLLENEGFSEEVKKGFLLSLLSSDGPIQEILSPNLLDQRTTMQNHIAGMSEEAFSYEEYESIRDKLLLTIHNGLTKQDNKFVLSVKGLKPDWSIYDFEKFPAVQWNILKLTKLKSDNPEKYQEYYEALKKVINAIDTG